MKLAICIVTRLTQNKFFTCVESIKKHTNRDTLANMEIRICYTGDDPSDVKDIQDKMNYLGIPFSVIQMPYNFAKCNNALVKQNESEYVLFLNDDVEIIDDSISHCLYRLQDIPNLGTVGLKLLYPDGRIQHGGQFVAYDKTDKRFLGVSHIGYKQPNIPFQDDSFTFGNTGAFLMCRREDFIKCGMFNEAYHHCFEDVELCGKMLLLGKQNLTCLSRSAIHHESITRNLEMSREDIGRIADFFNKNNMCRRYKQ